MAGGAPSRAASPPRATRWVAVALLLLAFGLRAHHLADQSLWFDEGWSAHVAALPPARALRAIAGDGHTHPPGYYLLLGAWTRAAGATEQGLRFLSVLEGVLLAAVGAALARRRFGRQAGIGALAALAMLPVLVVYSQETRMYMQLALLYLALIWAFHDAAAARDRTWRPWLVLGALETAALYTHYFAAILIGWLGLVAVARASRAATHPARRRRALTRLFGTQAVVAALFLPWAAVAFRQLGGHVPRTVTPQPLRDYATQTWYFFNAGVLGMAEREPLVATAAAAAGVLFVLVAAWALAYARGRRAIAMLLLHALVPIAVVYAIGQLRPGVHPRYVLMASAPLVLALAGSVAALGAPGRGALARRVLALATGAAFLAAWGVALRVYDRDPFYQRDDVRGAAERVEAESAPGDAVIVDYDDHAFRYYFDGPARLGILDATRDEHAVAAELAALAAPGGTVFLIEWKQGRTDHRGMLPALLEANGRYEGWDRHYGLRVHRYVLAPDAALAVPTLRSERAGFGVVHLVGAWADDRVSAADGLPVALRWSLPRATDRRLKSVVALLDPAGNRVAQADTLIQDGRGLTTERWAPGAESTMYAVVPVPVGTVPGTYRLEVGVYAEDGRGSRAELDPSDAPSAARHDLGSVAVGPGPTDDRDPYRTVAALGLTDLGRPALAPGIAVEGVRFDPPQVEPGQRVSVAVLWRAATAPANPIVPTLRLSRDGVVLAAARASSALAAHPPDRWRAGERLLDRRDLYVPSDAAGGPARLEVVLGDRVLPLGVVDVSAAERRYDAPDTAHAVDGRFPGSGALVGFNLAAEGRCRLRDAATDAPRLAIDDPADCRLLLELVWAAHGRAPVAYTVFNHLLAADRTMLAQHDGPPADGQRPTSGWADGEYVVDRHPLTFGATDVRPGPATLEVGLYDPATLARAPTDDGADHVVLPITLHIDR